MYKRLQTRAMSHVPEVPAQDELCAGKTRVHVRSTTCVYIYEGDSKSKGKIHLTAVIQETVSNFTYYFST